MGKSLLHASVLAILVCVWASARQLVVDPGFRTGLVTPSYSNPQPTVAIDEGHANVFTASGRFKPLVSLLASDGYRVITHRNSFDRSAFAGVDVLVIGEAGDQRAIGQSRSAFSERECDVVRDWVREGGSLLLAAGHAPFGAAAAQLAMRFGVDMSDGWVFDRKDGGITTELEFSRQDGLPGDHAILQGRNSRETIARVQSFAGQSLGVAPGAAVLLKLSRTAREAETADDLEAEEAAYRQEIDIVGSRSVSVAGRAQGLALSFGLGRVVVLGDADLLSAQIARSPDGGERKIGINMPASDNQQFALNILHWLSRLLN